MWGEKNKRKEKKIKTAALFLSTTNERFIFVGRSVGLEMITITSTTSLVKMNASSSSSSSSSSSYRANRAVFLNAQQQQRRRRLFLLSSKRSGFSSSSSSSSSFSLKLLRNTTKSARDERRERRRKSDTQTSRNATRERIKTRANIEPATDQDDDDDGENFAGAGFLEGWKGELILKNIDLNKAAVKNYVGIRDRLLQLDPGLNQTLISSGTSISQLFDQDKWEKHRRVNRFFYDLQNIPSSTVFLRLVRVLLTLTFLAYLVLIMPGTLYNLTHKMVPYASGIVPLSLVEWMKQSTIETFTFQISPLFHTMLGTVLGLVLVF